MQGPDKGVRNADVWYHHSSWNRRRARSRRARRDWLLHHRVPTASADADCTVSGLSNAIGTVGAQTGQWFASHPDANKAVTDAGGQGGGAEAAIRNYFVAHPSEWAELQRIAQPLRTLRQQCGSNVRLRHRTALRRNGVVGITIRRVNPPPADIVVLKWDLGVRVPMVRWSFWRLVLGAHRLNQTGQVGDGRERAVVDYVVSHARER